MNLDTFLKQLKHSPRTVEFDDSIDLIDSLYDFTPVSFRNGDQYNAAGENNGSCKVLAFAQLHDLTEPETLACFGRYYRDEVLGNPDGSSHANIRNFMTHGWPGVVFAASPFTPK